MLSWFNEMGLRIPNDLRLHRGIDLESPLVESNPKIASWVGDFGVEAAKAAGPGLDSGSDPTWRSTGDAGDGLEESKRRMSRPSVAIAPYRFRIFGKGR